MPQTWRLGEDNENENQNRILWLRVTKVYARYRRQG